MININTISLKILKFLKEKNFFNLNNDHYLRAKLRIIFTSFTSYVYNTLPKSRLIKTFEICLSDKSYNHKFLYDLLQQLTVKKKVNNILEIGIGGHNDNFSGGHSLVALKHFFKNANIFGIDIISKKFLDRSRIKTLICSQNDLNKQKKIGKNLGPFDLVIDDGSHFTHHQKKSFLAFFNYLKPGGIYIIEDIQGSYINAWGGDPDLGKNNLISFLSKKIHSVNLEYMTKKNQLKLSGYEMIDKIFFIKNSVLIVKKESIEKKYKLNIRAYETLKEKNIRLDLKKTKEGFYNKK